MNQFDVIVVGAGPAGCATAIACAQRGLHVAILERAAFPRHRPGETLHPAIEPLLGQLGMLSELSGLRHQGHWVEWGAAPRFVEFGGDTAGPWRGFHIERAELDTQLLNRVRALGVRIIQPCVRPRVVREGNRVAGVTLGTARLLAACVVDASGGHGWLRRQLPIQWQAFSPQLIARYGYCQGKFGAEYEAPRLNAVKGGWQWIARVDRDLLHWTTLSFDSGSAFTAQVPDTLKPLIPVGPVRGADVSWCRSDAPMGPGYLQVGDAAAILDPASSHGVLKALMSGMQAAQAIADCRAWPDGERVVHQHFNTWLHTRFNADVDALRQFYRAHPWPPKWA